MTEKLDISKIPQDALESLWKAMYEMGDNCCCIGAEYTDVDCKLWNTAVDTYTDTQKYMSAE